eukprot:scaffold53736_cov39-Cyclotella_meneghiniana.AAC.2
MPVVIQSPVARRKVASFCACACSRGQAGVRHTVRLASACQSVVYSLATALSPLATKARQKQVRTGASRVTVARREKPDD